MDKTILDYMTPKTWKEKIFKLLCPYSYRRSVLDKWEKDRNEYYKRKINEIFQELYNG